MSCINNLKLEWEPDYYQVKVSFDIPCDEVLAVRAIWEAFCVRDFGRSAYILAEEEDLWVNGSINIDSVDYYIGANAETRRLIIATDRRSYGDEALDGMSYCHPAHLDLQWIEFVKPIKKVLEILRCHTTTSSATTRSRFASSPASATR